MARPRYSGDSVWARSHGFSACAAMTRSVRMKPGATATAVTPRSRRSWAIEKAKRAMHAFAAS